MKLVQKCFKIVKPHTSFSSHSVKRDFQQSAEMSRVKKIVGIVLKHSPHNLFIKMTRTFAKLVLKSF